MSQKPVPPALQFLLEAERSRPDAPAEAKALAQLQLAALLGPTAGLGDGGSGGGTAAGPAGTPPPGTATTFARGVKVLTAAKVVGIFALGGLAGGGVSALVRPETRLVYVDRPVPTLAASLRPAASAGAEIPLVPEPSSAPRAPIALPAAAASSAGPRLRDTDLAAERALLERARSALAHGDGASALTAVQEHERAFPRGQLVEEREVLAVQSLVTAGRAGEAAERGARFRKTFPGSLLLPVVEQVLR